MAIKDADFIIHLGDFTSPDLLDYFKTFNNFYGIAGNHDPHCIKSILPKATVIEINKKRLGLLHGYWFPFICDSRSLRRFKNENVDAIIFGHTHVVRNDDSSGMLFFNPGSASALWPAPEKTYGVLEIGETIQRKINLLGTKRKDNKRKTSGERVIELVCGKNRLKNCIDTY